MGHRRGHSARLDLIREIRRNTLQVIHPRADRCRKKCRLTRGHAYRIGRNHQPHRRHHHKEASRKARSLPRHLVTGLAYRSSYRGKHRLSICPRSKDLSAYRLELALMACTLYQLKHF